MVLQQVKPRYGLGQSFLVDPAILAFEAERAEVSRGDVVLEIGPGIGNLTEVLLGRGASVVAIEADQQFAPFLDGLRARYGRLEVIWGDATTVGYPRFDRAVANLPYRIALPLVFRLLECDFRRAVLMVQERLARRLAARPGERGYSRIAVTASLDARVRIAKVVPRNAFVPPPDVPGALLDIQKRRHRIEVPDPRAFRDMLDVLFEQRDAPLTRTEGLGPRGVVRRAIGELPSATRERPVGQLTPEAFAELARALDRHGARARTADAGRRARSRSR